MKRSLLTIAVLSVLSLNAFSQGFPTLNNTTPVSDMRLGPTMNGSNSTDNNTGVIKWTGGSTNELGLFTWQDAKPIRIGGTFVKFQHESGNPNTVLMPGKLRIGPIYTTWDNWRMTITTDPTNLTYQNGLFIRHMNAQPYSYGLQVNVNNNLTNAFVVANETITTGNNHVFKIYGNGHVYCTELEVMAAGTFPDYVFSDKYNLMPLGDLGKYIKLNSHLPNIPSAKEIADKGSVPVGELQIKMLEKIEELTLYMLQLQKENKELAAKVLKLESDN